MNDLNLHAVRRQCLNALSKSFPQREAEQLCRILLEDLFGMDWRQQLLNPDLRLEASQRQVLEAAVQSLLAGMPVQYVAGMARFGDLVLKVNPSVLIPRPETEEMVQKIAGSGIRPRRIWDIGTGSGCIAIALAKIWPHAEVFAFDCSAEALATAHDNAERNDANVSFVCEDVMSPCSEILCQPVDLIVSNPPYVCERERAAMEANVLDYEPELALFVPDNDPLRFYRQILDLARRQLTEKGKVWFEINEAYSMEMKQLCHEMGFAEVQVLADFAEKPRFCVAGACGS